MSNNFTPEESLAVIHSAIGQTQQNIKDDSIHFLIWGCATLLASLSHYILLTIVHYQHPYIAWACMPLAGVFAGIVGYKASKKAKVKTHIDRILGYLWGGFGVYLLMILAFMPIIGYDKTYPLVIGLYGLGSFIMGGIIQFNALKIGAVICWLIAALSFTLSFPNQLLCVASAIIVAYLIPGYLLKFSEK